MLLPAPASTECPASSRQKAPHLPLSAVHCISATLRRHTVPKMNVECDTQQQSVDINHKGTKTIIQTIRDTLTTKAQVILPTAEGEEDLEGPNEADVDEYGIKNYWDASSMAPLSATSAVRTIPPSRVYTSSHSVRSSPGPCVNSRGGMGQGSTQLPFSPFHQRHQAYKNPR